MADPFVQRMMARSQARRNVTNNLCFSSNKENNLENSIPKQCDSSPKLLSKTAELPPGRSKNSSSPASKMCTSDPLRDSSNSVQSTSTLGSRALPTHSEGRSRSQRLKHLSDRARQMQEWEDDYTYHSLHSGLTKEVEQHKVSRGLHDASSHPSDSSHVSAARFSSRGSCTSSVQPQKNDTAINSPKKYYYGESPNEKHITNTPSSLHAYSNSNSQKLKEKSFTHFTPSNSASKLASSFSNDAKASPKQSSSSQTSLTPTRKLAWDRSLLDSLEAQGYSPSKSRSKLLYDFADRDRSPIKGGFSDREKSPIKRDLTDKEKSPIKGDFAGRDRSPIKAGFADREKSPIKGVVEQKENGNVTSYSTSSHVTRHHSPSKSPQRQFSPSKTANQGLGSDQCRVHPLPKILHVQPKQMPETENKNVYGKNERELQSDDGESTGVNNLKSKWEEHIRRASPERQSPVRQRSPSPIRKQFLSSPRLDGNSTRPNRASSYQKLRGTLSSSSGEVVRGTIAMPQTTPVVSDQRASVKEKAAAFSLIASRLSPERDPTELNLRDRKTIFEQNKGPALVPKVPFGQCLAGKALRESASLPEASPCGSSVGPRPFKSNSNSGFKAVNNNVNDKLKRFEAAEDLQDGVQQRQLSDERKREMEFLLNRFKKPANPSHQIPPISKPSFPEPDESDIDNEMETSSEFEPEVSSYYRQSETLTGPPKPPRVPEYSSHSGSPSTDRSGESFGHSPMKRMNSTEVGESTSPVTGVAATARRKQPYVPKVKPGCLFPSLSDIESHSEAVESAEEDENENALTGKDAESSLGAAVKRMAEAHKRPAPLVPSGNSHLSTIDEFSSPAAEPRQKDPSMSASTLEAIGAIDDALEEAFSDTEPTPPKRGRLTPDWDDDLNETDRGSLLKNPRLLCQSPSSSSTSSATSATSSLVDTPLAHSVSMYRKQKPAEIAVTPVRQITLINEAVSPTKAPVSPSITIGARIRLLQQEEDHQLTVISQASSALNVVSQHPQQQHGTTQHVEAEKLLLVASQKRQALLHEIQRLKTEGALGKRSSMEDDDDSCRGSISISNVTLPLKRDFLDKKGDERRRYFVLVLVKHRDQVISSELQSMPECIVEGAISFPNLISVHNLSADFSIALEVHALKLESPYGLGAKKDQNRLKLTPLKRLHREKAPNSPSVVSSPGGPFAVRSSSFQLIGFAHLNITTLTRNAWTLEKVPFNSPVSGHLLMRVAVTMEGGVSERSFLTIFDDVGGFGSWNRRWCVLRGPFIKYWRYPDDEGRKECLGAFDLRSCTTRRVELVSRDVCARQFTFQLTFVRPRRQNDKSNLVHEVKDNALISRYLMSADGKEERITWCSKLNRALANIRAWDPDSLKPDDFQV